MKLNLSFLFLIAFQIVTAQICDKKNIKLDHIFTVANLSASTIAKIEQSGLSIAKDWQTPHAGQGTKGNFIFFMNFYLEILQVSNPDEAANNAINMGVNLNERIFPINIKNSPFGIGLVQTIENLNEIPFVTKTYHQTWMGKGNKLQMATPLNNQIPIIFVEPKSFANEIFTTEDQLLEAAKYNPLAKTYREHSNKIKNLTSAQIIMAGSQTSDAVKILKSFQNLKISTGKAHLLILNFDNKAQKKQIDLSKELGVIINY